MKQFDYKEKYKEVMENLEKEKAMVLATSDGDKVAARAVWFVLYESSINLFINPKTNENFLGNVFVDTNIQDEGIGLIIWNNNRKNDI